MILQKFRATQDSKYILFWHILFWQSTVVSELSWVRSPNITKIQQNNYRILEELVLYPLNVSSGRMKILKLCRMLRIFRVAKLGRHNKNLRTMIRTFAASSGELAFMMSLISLSIIVFSTMWYFHEHQETNTQVPVTNWYLRWQFYTN